MATFFKYKEREDIGKSMIDWSGVTKKISDDLIQEKTRRDGVKQEIEVDQVNKLSALEEYTKGLDPTMNGKMLEIAQNYKDFLLESHKLMKNGLISVNDTKIKKQGSMDTFNAINDTTKVYNEKMAAFMEKGGSVNDFMAESAARVLNIADSTLIIDPKNGRGSFVSTDENGNEIIIPATSFNTVLNDTYERFDATTEVGNIMKNAGTWTRAISSTYTVNDLRQNPEYNKWKKARVSGILNSDKKIISAAADLLEMKPTFDKELVNSDPDKYFLAESKNGKIVFKMDGLKEKVAEALETQIEIAIGREERRTATSTARESDASRGRREEASQLYNISMRLSKGDSAAFGSVKDRQFTIVNSDGTKKTAILGLPVKVGNSILFNDRDGNVVTTVELTGNDIQDGQNIAGVIRNELPADQLQGLFRLGAQEANYSIPSNIGDPVTAMGQESIIENLPVNEDRALEFLKANLDTDIFAIDIPFTPGSDTIRIRHKKTDESTGEVKTTDIDAIKDFLSKYNAVPMMITQPAQNQNTTQPVTSNLNASNRKS